MRLIIKIALLVLLMAVAGFTGPEALAADDGFKPLDSSSFKTLDSSGFKPLEPPSSGAAPENGFAPLDSSGFTPLTAEAPHPVKSLFDRLFYPGLAIIFTLVAALLVRFHDTRLLRPIILLGSLALFGFYNGGCPCVISSFQDLALLGLGVDVEWHKVVWFLGILVTAYLFGRVWCGWVCHLGAFQEFLYRKNSFKFLKGARAQALLRWSRRILFATLLIQLFVTRQNLFVKIDPFKAAFNVSSYYLTGWILLGLLLLASLFIYRPFCRGACPVGLVLGLTSRLPGALKLGRKDDCNACQRCAKICESAAISQDSQVRSADCIMCGECVDSCRTGCVLWSRK